MRTKRIIPCLDVYRGRVVKGTNFAGLQDAGDPVEQAVIYSRDGADELVFLDIAATSEGRATMLGTVRQVADSVSIPFCVGGGVRTVDDMRSTLLAGADKIAANSAAVRTPDLINMGAERFGSHRIVVAIDALWNGANYEVYISGGRLATGLDAAAWAREVERRGAGEILLTSIDRDGTNEGYDLSLTRAVTDAVGIPVIASGGAGEPDHLRAVLDEGGADAALAAGLFHFRKWTIGQVKEYLRAAGLPVRLAETGRDGGDD